MERVRARELRVARFLQAHIVIGHHGVDAGDLVALGEQTAAEMEADEAGAAGDQKSHDPWLHGIAVPRSRIGPAS